MSQFRNERRRAYNFEPGGVFSWDGRCTGTAVAPKRNSLSLATQEFHFGHTTRSEDLVQEVSETAENAAANGARPGTDAAGTRATCGA